MVLHVEKTLKTTIQKKLQKSQKFARKISVAELYYSQNIFLQFTVTLFHSNVDGKITSNEQKVTSNEHKVTWNKQVQLLLQEKVSELSLCETKEHSRIQTAQNMFKLLKSKIKVKLFRICFLLLDYQMKKQPAKYSLLLLVKGLAGKNICAF